jgi:hypothetical protein
MIVPMAGLRVYYDGVSAPASTALFAHARAAALTGVVVSALRHGGPWVVEHGYALGAINCAAAPRASSIRSPARALGRA